MPPVGPYEDFEECVEANQDKDDPEAYCAEIERETEEASTLPDGTIRKRAMRNPYALLPTFTFRVEGVVLADASGTVLLAPINLPSDDGRVIVDTLGWREEPLPFMASDSEMGHGDATRVGNLTDFEEVEVDGHRWIRATVTFDSDAENGDYFATLAEEGSFNGVSIHMGKAEFYSVVLEEDGTFRKLSFEEMIEAIEDLDDDEIDAFFETIYLGAFEAEIAAATQVAIPAFPGARIDESSIVTEADDETAALAASVGLTPEQLVRLRQMIVDVDYDYGGPVLASSLLERPPAEWFEAPDGGPVGLTVTDEGRVYGYLALWDTCHTGYSGTCVRAPRGADYSTFLTSRVIADDGSRIPVGPLVVDDGHASAEWDLETVMNYYADTKLAAAYVAVGEDDYGVWVAGAASHKASDEQVETLRRHPLSGDWRPYKGSYRLIAAVSVNSPGLPVPEVLVASGEPVGLITYGPFDSYATDLALVASALETIGHSIADFRAELLAERERPEVDAAAEELLATFE